ncbi:unnamed protein product [Mesocestoides corti]|uniref:Uncharacterized protein n=1 Tax=Mesocestoides corti TaxID=53468 RepID=A0A0R3UGC8_MESCO|nr:unnamed protein product [Mesocestoides corti]
MLRNSQTNAPGGQRPKPRFKIEKRRNRAPRFMRQLNSLDFSRFRKKNDIMRRPSVAFADYEIKDKRSSIMSSLLLLSALMEGVASFVLPIIDAFGPPKHVEHKFYFEVSNKMLLSALRLHKSPDLTVDSIYPSFRFLIQVFQIIQFTASILALAYLQALMIYYDWKRQRREVLTQKLMRSSRDSSEEPYRTDEDRDNDSVVSVDPECSRTIEAPYQPVQIVENNVEISEDASSEVPPNAVFGFGVMIMDGFRVADQFRAEKIIFACHSVLWIPVNLIHSVYVFWQTYFLFKYHRVRLRSSSLMFAFRFTYN